MKSLLGAGVLVAMMGAGALSSDALSGFDAPDTGQHQKQQQAEKKAEKKAQQRAAQVQRKLEKRAAQERTRPEHPLGGPPGQQQRGRGEPPDWAGGPDDRTAEPPGLANKAPDHPANSRGRP